MSKQTPTQQVSLYHKTKNGLITRIYASQRTSSKKRKHNPPTYSKEELRDWLYSQPKFHILYDNWKRLDYQTMYKPSIDRKDDYLGYTMDNIQLMTWRENKDKGYSDKRRGKNNKINKAIMQYTKQGVFITRFHSIMEAQRILNIANTNISQCCSGIRKTAGGFVWCYEDKGD